MQIRIIRQETYLMSFHKHDFTETILKILEESFGALSTKIFEKSEILQYLNIKTKAASKGSKSRLALANHYALFVLVEDYLNNGFHQNGRYAVYEGAIYSCLLRRQRELPFGRKLQNHALNHRLNEEFKKFFPTCENLPVVRDAECRRYWINERLLRLNVDDKTVNLAPSVKRIIEAYVEARKKAFSDFMAYCDEIIEIQKDSPAKAVSFIKNQLRPAVDARIFEIVSFSILKYYYRNQKIYWGWSLDGVKEDVLVLYKTGRTNANDGGIDFVMKPLGRFFQVTETVDAGKYFLDIDKVQRYPITFVVKSNDPEEVIVDKIRKQAEEKYHIKAIVQKHIECIEEIINIPALIEIFERVLDSGHAGKIIEEIVLQSRVEFNVQPEPE